ncbi:hypothetical protein AB0F88_18085 [Streptosporangium sp. NPDC023963]|uniref:hypothetical protein n=1 Tax=Streptosporangium sp. NPDC023963 TaxID=3155608 RepID=UPI003444A89C
MALSRMNNCLKSLVGPLGAVLLAVGLGWATLYFFFGPDVRRVDPDVLPELRTVGRVVGEEAVMVHEWENAYVEMNDLVIYFDGDVKNDILAAAERRLNQSGWSVSRREPPEIWVESARWPSVLVTVEQFKGAHMSSDLREQVAATGLPMDNMAYMSVRP